VEKVRCSTLAQFLWPCWCECILIRVLNWVGLALFPVLDQNMANHRMRILFYFQTPVFFFISPPYMIYTIFTRSLPAPCSQTPTTCQVARRANLYRFPYPFSLSFPTPSLYRPVGPRRSPASSDGSWNDSLLRRCDWQPDGNRLQGCHEPYESIQHSYLSPRTRISREPSYS